MFDKDTGTSRLALRKEETFGSAIGLSRRGIGIIVGTTF
jgi:hypothetical protein